MPLLEKNPQLGLPFKEIKCAKCGFTSKNEHDFIVDPTDHQYYCHKDSMPCDACSKYASSYNIHAVTIADESKNLCGICYTSLFKQCPTCKSSVYNEDILPPMPAVNGSEGDDRRLGGCKKCSVQCDDCAKVVNKENAYRYNNSDYCEECFYEYAGYCNECSEVTDKDDLTYVEDEGDYCPECFEENFFTCDDCKKSFDKSDVESLPNGDICRSCFNESYGRCENCDRVVSGDEIMYAEDLGSSLCRSCYEDKFTVCHECGRTVDSDVTEEDDRGNQICEKCYTELRGTPPKQYEKYTEFSESTYNKKSKYLDLIKKIVPISVKELNQRHQRLASGLSDLIKTLKGKDITQEAIAKYEGTLPNQTFPVEYGQWTSDSQRSVENSNNAQLVINVLASPEMLSTLKEDNALYDLFDKINTLSKQSTHPYKKDQFGWARVELHPVEEPATSYILVDEIQSDHQNALNRIKQKHGDGLKIYNQIKASYSLTEEQMDALLNKYAEIIKDFSNVAMKVISDFARTNGFKKIFWHTFEGGKKLKRNKPPKSIYDSLPKEHFFAPTQEKPFGLDADFFEREAKAVNRLKKLARKLVLKNYKSF